MSTVIFRTAAPVIVGIMLVFSVYICLRGHNEPGGGFIGGLIGATAIAVYGMAVGVSEVRRALRAEPIAIAAVGVLLAAIAGLFSAFVGSPYMTSIWLYIDLGETTVPLSTPLFFDLGVYLVVFGTLSAVALGLEGTTAEEGQ